MEILLGISWSATKIKIASLYKKGKGYAIRALDRLDVSANNPEEATLLLRQWVEKNLPSGATVRVALAIPESSIFLKELELPKSKHADLATTIFWEISSIAPLPAEQAVLAWKIISQGKQTTRLAALVIRDELAQQLLETFAAAGIKLSLIEPYSLAFGRIINRDLAKTTLLVAVESDETNFVILKNGAPVFSTSVLIKRMEDSGRTLDLSSTKTLAIHTKQALAFWKEKEEGVVDEVVITGDVLKYFGLASAIYRLTHVPAFLAKAKKPLSVTRGTFSLSELNQFLIPLGAALRLILREAEGDVNLFPKREQQLLLRQKAEKAVASKISLFFKATLVVLIVNLLILVGFSLLSARLSRDLDQTERFVGNHPAQNLIARVSETNSLVSEIDRLMGSQKDAGERLRRIATLTPTTVRFTTLKFSGKEDEQWEIGGVADRNDVLAFYTKIAVEAGAKEVSMPYSNLAKEKENEFTIKIVWH